MKSDNSISTLIIAAMSVTPNHTINDVAQLFLLPENKKLLCLPIINDNGLLLGTLSRQRLQEIFMARFGRELYGRHKVTKVMNSTPLMVEKNSSIEDAAEYVSTKIEVPITEDFVIVDNGRYVGIGFVLDLLKAMEERVHARNNELADAYRHLKESQAQLIQSEKMASLGQMVAGVAHEINTPLGYVRNNVELTRSTIIEVRKILNVFENTFALLLSGTADENVLQNEIEQLEQMRTNFYEVNPLDDLDQLFDDTLYGIGQISEIVLGLKNFSRLDQAAVANININQCIENTLIIAKNVLKHKCDVIKQFAELPTISCSPSQINQVFLNLLTNAVQAIEQYGTITIATWSDGNYVYARVADNGKGISEGNLSKIFDPFFTTKPIGQGTGLGLSIVYNIIEQHHGRIKVESKLDIGTQFTICLPCSKDDANTAGTSESTTKEEIQIESTGTLSHIDIFSTPEPKENIQSESASYVSTVDILDKEKSESELDLKSEAKEYTNLLPKVVPIEPASNQPNVYLRFVGVVAVISILSGIWYFFSTSNTKVPELPAPAPQPMVQPVKMEQMPQPPSVKAPEPPAPTPQPMQPMVQPVKVEQMPQPPNELQSTTPDYILALSPENLSTRLTATPQPIRQEAEANLYAYIQKIPKRNKLVNWEAYRRLVILNPNKNLYRTKANFFALSAKKQP
jgi:signal transduction histidine kinase